MILHKSQKTCGFAILFSLLQLQQTQHTTLAELYVWRALQLPVAPLRIRL